MSTIGEGRPTRRKGFASSVAGLGALLVVLVLSLHVALAHAAGSSASIAIFNDTNATVPTGQATQYTINFECSAVDPSDCGTGAEITVPISLTSADPPGSTADPSDWTYTASSSTDLVQGESGSTPVTLNYSAGTVTIPLNSASISPGQSLTVQLFVTQPNNTTPNDTTWTVNPSFSTGAISAVTVPTPATGEASADPDLEVSKKTSNGATIYVSGNDVTYNITANCGNSGRVGNLYLTDGSLVDTLPAGLTYVSSTPAATVSGDTLTWDYPTASDVPSGCSLDGAGANNYSVTVQIPAGSDGDTFTNSVAYTGDALGGGPEVTSAQTTISAVGSSPNPGSIGTFITKGSLAPLNIAGVGNQGTYPGPWMASTNETPGYQANASEAAYHVAINYQQSGAYETAVNDPVPCLTNSSGGGATVTTYTSNAPGTLCQDPAFDPTVFEVTAGSLGEAVNDDSWQPTIMLENGNIIPLAAESTVSAGATSAYYEIPAADVGTVAQVNLPADPDLSDPSTNLYVWGYMDPSLVATNVVQNVASATATQLILPSGQPAPLTATQTASAPLYIEQQEPQLGVTKSFGSYTPPSGIATMGTAPVGMTGTLVLPGALPAGQNVVLTDLLPQRLSWSNPVASANFNVSKDGGGAATVSGTITDTPNYKGTGQELIRITLAASAFSTGGYYQISPQSGGLLTLNVPTGIDAYVNNDQEFVQTVGDNVLPTCVSGNAVESSDPNDLDGDGATAEDYCQASATLDVPGVSGPDVSLQKQVEGANDSAFLNPTSTSLVGTNGVGSTTANGPGTFKLTWQNFGTTNLTEPVIYDILPYVGDTGVSGGQAGTARGSQFPTVFAGGVNVTTGALTGSSVPSSSQVEVLYSTSTNPCRPEVYANADNPSCVADWTSTPPSDLSTVKALEFVDTTGSDSWEPGDTITATFNVTVPAADVNLIAWNSAATTAEANGTDLLPAEPPKVGIEAPLTATPNLSTAVSNAAVTPGTTFSDSVNVTGTENGTGSDAWKLVGPVAPELGSCSSLDWSGAATVDSGTITVSADGTYNTPTDAPTAPGCYSYVDTLTGSSWHQVNVAAGTLAETVLVATPSITTAISSAATTTGDSVTDAMTVTNTQGQVGQIDWQLLGPVAPGSDGTCATADWTGAKTADSGTVVVFGDGVYTTSATQLTTLGCYGYAATLSGANFGGTSTSPAGSTDEVVNVTDQSLSTQVSSASVENGGSVSDSVTVTGTGGRAGEIDWRLLGPVAAGADGTCVTATWSGAPTVDSGKISISADGTYKTGTTQLTSAGCYGYTATLAGSAYASGVTSPAGTSGEVVQVSNPIQPPPSVTTPTTTTPTTTTPPSVTITTSSTTPTKTPTKTTKTATKPSKAKAPQLTITKTVNAQSVTAGHSLTFTITVKNTGAGAAKGVKVTDTPQTKMEFVSAKPTQGSCSKGFPLTCTADELAAGGKITIVVVATPQQAGNVANEATVEAQNAGGVAKAAKAQANSKVIVPLTLAQSTNVHTVHAGAKVRFRIRVANPTGVAAPKSVICEQLPRGLALVSSSQKHYLSNGSICWTVKSIPAHSAVVIAVEARALTGVSGKLVGRATLNGTAIPTQRAAANVAVVPAAPKASAVTG